MCICGHMKAVRGGVKGRRNAKALRQESFWGAVTKNGVKEEGGS